MSLTNGTRDDTDDEPGQAAEMATPGYAERLWVPPLWSLFAFFLLLTLWLAYASVLGAVWANLISGSMTVLVVVGFTAYGLAPVRVDAAGVRAGRAQLPLTAVGAASALTVEQASRLRGREANAAAYHLVRPYLKRAVLIEVADEQDPAPYWYVATRHPERLADAINEARPRR